MTARQWSDRFLAYCRATGDLSPEATLVRDAALYPGGRMAGFLIWSGERRRVEGKA